MKTQQGVVLFFAIIILLVMTVIGVSLATNSSMSLQMAGGSSEKMQCQVFTDGQVESAIAEILTAKNLGELTVKVNDLNARNFVIEDNNTLAEPISCPRSIDLPKLPNQKCVILELTKTNAFGKANNGRACGSTGVVWPFISASG